LGTYNLPLILRGLIFLMRRRERSEWFVFMWISIISVLLILTLPDHRYFMIIFPALAITCSLWAQAQPPEDVGRLTFLLLIYQIGALYLLMDWNRVSELFIPQ